MPPMREITKEAVLQAALDIVCAEGLGAVTARSVAARLHCSTQPIYSLFSGMQELSDAVYARALQAAMEAIHGHRDEGMPPELQPVLGLYCLAREQPHLYRAVFLSVYRQGPQAMEQLGPKVLTDHLPKSQRLSLLTEQNFRHVTHMISVFVAGLGLLSLGGDLPQEEAVKLTEDMYQMTVNDQLSAQTREAAKSANTETLGKRLGVGANAEVFEYGSGRVIKLFYDRARAHGIQWEYRRSLAVWELGLPVPRPYGIVDIGERPGLVMERIDGASLAESLFIRGDVGALRTMAHLLHRVHSIAPEQARATGLRPPKADLAWTVYRNEELTDAEKRAIAHVLAELPDGDHVCHGDFHMLNVLMRGGEPVLIDWQGAFLGDAALDVMWMLLILRYAVVPEGMMPAPLIQAFYDSRAEFERIFFEEYHRLTGMTMEQVEAWFLPCAVSRLWSDLHPAEHDAILAEIRRRCAADATDVPMVSVSDLP